MLNHSSSITAWGARARLSSFTVALAGALLNGCAQIEQAPEPAQLTSPTTVRSSAASPSERVTTARQERGRISMYGAELAGRKTASGELFDPAGLTMAHRTLPFGTRVRVTNLANQRSVEVVVNDRGPFVSGRIADLSTAAARRLGMVADGVVEALLQILQPAEKPAAGDRVN